MTKSLKDRSVNVKLKDVFHFLIIEYTVVEFLQKKLHCKCVIFEVSSNRLYLSIAKCMPS